MMCKVEVCMCIKRTWSPTVMTRCFSTSGLPRQNQHGPLGAGGGPLAAWEEESGGVGKRAERLASGAPLSGE